MPPPSQAGAVDAFAEVVVTRRNGADGRVQIDYATKDGSATAGRRGLEGNMRAWGGGAVPRPQYLGPCLDVGVQDPPIIQTHTPFS